MPIIKFHNHPSGFISLRLISCSLFRAIHTTTTMLLEVRKEDYCLGVHYRQLLFSIDQSNSSKPFATFCIHKDSFQKVSYSTESSSHDDDHKKMAIPIKGNRVNIDDFFDFLDFPTASSFYDDLSGLILNVKHLPVDTYRELLDDIISLSLISMINEIETIIRHDVTVEFVVVVVIHRNDVSVTKKDVVKYLESRPIVLDCEEEEEEERCTICLGSGSGSVIQMDCLHQFHEKCITRWFDKRKYSCPLCRFDMATAVIESMFSKPLN